MSIYDHEKSIRLAGDLLRDIPKGAEAAAARAFNRALEAGRAAAVREVTKRYTVKAKDVRPTFSMKKASKSNLNAELVSRGIALPLRAFEHKPTTDTTGKRRKPVRVTITSGKTSVFTTSFVWNRNIFGRLGDKRLPIYKMVGSSVPGMLGSDEISDDVQNVMAEAAEKRLAHELNRLAEGER